MNNAITSGSEYPSTLDLRNARYLFMALLAAVLAICVAATTTPAAAQQAEGSSQSAGTAKTGEKAAKKKKVVKKKKAATKTAEKKSQSKKAGKKSAGKKKAQAKEAKPKKAKKTASADPTKKKAGKKKKQMKKADKPNSTAKKKAGKKKNAAEKDAAADKPKRKKKVEKKKAEKKKEQVKKADKPNSTAKKKNAAEKDAAADKPKRKKKAEKKKAKKKKAAAEKRNKKRAAKRKKANKRGKRAARKVRNSKIKREQRRRYGARHDYRELRRDDALAVFIDGAVRAIEHYNGGTIVGYPTPPPAVAANRRYVKQLPNGRQRIVVVRPNGIRTVTVRARNGGIVRRTRHFPDGRIVVLIDNRPYYAIPRGQPLPPPLPPRATYPGRLSAPDTSQASAYELEQALSAPPPVPVERNYSIEELRQDGEWLGHLNRVDVKSITFATGSAHIDNYEIPKLADLAGAMHKIIARNPNEIFMVSGHTDLVGDEFSNLELSNRRAQAIADALVQFYAIPPQNLVTQGYGERYPVIPTPYAERQNRRVSVQRITPLLRTSEPDAVALPPQVR